MSHDRYRTAPRILATASVPDATSLSTMRTEQDSAPATSFLVNSRNPAGLPGFSMLFFSGMEAIWSGDCNMSWPYFTLVKSHLARAVLLQILFRPHALPSTSPWHLACIGFHPLRDGAWRTKPPR